MNYEYIQATCRTNLDNYDCSITKKFLCVPSIGHNVRVLYKGNVTYLKVVAITHCDTSGAPYIEIELHN